jgi:3-hydroxyacyl-[acyl-carrier-protein] dehydratase
VRLSEDFAHSMVVLKQAGNVKYAQFVEPGQSLTVTAEILSQDDAETKVKAQGSVDGRTIVSGRLVLARYNLTDSVGADPAVDESIRHDLRGLFNVIYQPGPTVPQTQT